MNEPAIKLEEQIISMFPEQETQICQGWILKKAGGNLCIYPLYYKFARDDTPEKIRRCEEIARQDGMGCVFRIVEHTNYYLSAVLEDCGYGVCRCGVVGICGAGDKRVEQTVVDIPGVEDLPEEYRQAGFCRAYAYQVYQKTED